MAIVMGFLASNLGTIFEASYGISATILSPVDGVFVTGMFAPWANSKVKTMTTTIKGGKLSQKTFS